MLLGTLKTITYPTGGSTTFEYEANDYYDPQGIKKLTNVNNITAAWPDGNCAANLASPNTLLRTFTTTELGDMFYQVETQRSNFYTATCADYSPSYQIKVYVGSSSTSVLCSATLTPSAEILSGNGGVGTIYKKGIASGKLIELLPCLQANMTYGTAIAIWKNYQIYTRPYRMGQTVSVLQGITTTTNYAYDPNLLPKRSETVTNSNGASTTSTYYYASDDPTNYAALVSRNMIGFPVKVKQKTGTAARWSKVEYDVFNGSTQLEPKYLKESFEDVPTNWITRVTIAAYTANGMPLTVYKNNFTVAENYTWTNKLLNQKTFGTGANLLTWSIAYKATTSLVEKVTDENGLIKKYIYDPLMRLQTVQDRMKADETDVQTTTNYTYQYKDANNAYSYIGTSMSFANTTGAAPLSTKQYMDGLGRAVSMVKENYTHGDALNQINNVAYDALGRQYRTYLPFTPNGSQATAGYVETGFEASPLSRPISHRNVDGTYKYMNYSANTAADAVQIFTPTTASGMVASAASSSTYAANTLYKTTITDENGKIACVFKDKLGRVILTRKFLNGATGANVDTYNVYDDFSQLVVVLPPGSVVGSGTVSISNELTFQYKYDSRNRLTEKKIPGAEAQKIYYDDRDLVALTQDGNMRTPASGGAADRYLATQYDEIGRVLRTGWVTTSDPVNFAKSGFTIPDGVNKLTETIYYPNRTWVKHQGAKVLKPTGVATATEFVWSYSERRVGLEYTGNPVWQGKQHLRFAAVSQVPITDNDTYGVDWVVSGYNGLQQPDLTIRYVYEGNGNDAKTWQNFTYDNGRRLTDIKYNYTTGGAGITSATFTLSNMVYNFKDQLVEKNIGWSSGSALQSIDYTYNTRGFLTNINNVALYNNGAASIMTPPMNGSGQIQNLVIMPYINQAISESIKTGTALTPPLGARGAPPVNDNNTDLFSQNLTYDNPASQTGAAGQYNGNISSTTWQVLGKAKQAYGFTYDGLDRLSVANYYDITEGYQSGVLTSQYSADNKFKEAVQYDVRGNIVGLQRNGMKTGGWTENGFVAGMFGEIDNLNYIYNAKNQVTSIIDGAVNFSGLSTAGKDYKGFVYNPAEVNVTGDNHYTYDSNGNLMTDFHKDITLITYNYLNLPQLITLTAGRTIQFVYDATGAKLKKITNDNGTLVTYDYINGVEYKNDALQRIAHTEGAVVKNEFGAYEHEYVLRDHLGNNRVTFRDGINKGDAYFDWNTWQYIDPNAGNTTGLNDGVITAADIKQVNHYYPFGLNIEGNWQGAAQGPNFYGYNDKEWNNDFGLGLNDYGARFYDPAMARWTTADPMADFRSWVSPYQYVQNNPINRIDPTGMIDQQGADGLTNDQWINANRSADGGQTGRMNTSRQGNRDAEVEHQRDLANKGMSRDVSSSDIAASYGLQPYGTRLEDSKGNVYGVPTIDGYNLVKIPVFNMCASSIENGFFGNNIPSVSFPAGTAPGVCLANNMIQGIRGYYSNLQVLKTNVRLNIPQFTIAITRLTPTNPNQLFNLRSISLMIVQAYDATYRSNFTIGRGDIFPNQTFMNLWSNTFNSMFSGQGYCMSGNATLVPAGIMGAQVDDWNRNPTGCTR